MTGNIRILLAQIAVLEQQHRAGLNPLCTELGAFFDTARLARLDVAALDAGMTPASWKPVFLEHRTVRDGATAAAALTFVRVADVTVPGGEVARFARALLDALDRSTVTPSIGPMWCGGAGGTGGVIGTQGTLS